MPNLNPRSCGDFRRLSDVSESFQAPDAHWSHSSPWSPRSPAGFSVPSDPSQYPRSWCRETGSNPLVPRAGVTWSAGEDHDLLRRAKTSTNLEHLAKIHGRTETAIACRLEHLGVDRGTLIAFDFAEAELRVVASLITDLNMGKTKMETRLDRLMLLTAISRGTLHLEASLPRTTANLAFLEMRGMVVKKGRQGYSLTDAGRAFVTSVLESIEAPVADVKSSVSVNTKRQKPALNPRRFYLVTSGDVRVTSSHGRAVLSNPPTVVHTSLDVAEQEAARLAARSPGDRYFVLSAVAVHEVRPAPTTRRTL